MKTKEQVDAMLKDMEGLKTRADDLEKKNRELEAEKARLLAGASVPTGSANSDEAKALRYFGCSHVKELLHVNTGDARWDKVPGEVKHIVRELKKSVDTARFVAQMFHGAPKDSDGSHESAEKPAPIRGMLDSYYGKHVLAPRLKAFGSTVATGGDEWVPTLISSQYVNEYELDFLLEDKFKGINMPSNPFDLPVQTGVTKAKTVAEGAAAADANFTTGKLTFSAKKFYEYYILPEELNEDSAPDILAVAREEVVKAQVRAIESAIISGDDDGTHLDSDTQAGAANLAEKAWKGLRRQAIANSATVTFGAAAVTAAKLREMRQDMGKFGVNPLELLWIAGPAVYQQLVGLDEVSTVEKFGPMATVLKGALAAFQGIPICVSQYMREDLNTSGVYDGVTTDKAGIILVNMQRWYVGTRRPIRTKIMQDLPSYDRWLLASYQRKDFQGHAQSASEKSVIYGINVQV